MPVRAAICKYCHKSIKSGRSDKKFCDSACKDSYYNAIKSEEQGEISKIDSILKKNRRVLKTLFDVKKPDKVVPREELIRQGFEFGFLTHVGVTKAKSNEITFCYDYGYREVKVGSYQLFHSFSKVRVKEGYVIKIS